LQANGIALGKWDAMKIDSPDYEKLKLVQQERVLEDSNGDFKAIVNRFEAKGIKKAKGQQILRIIRMKQDRIRAGEPFKH
jgi:hypothetical protein